ncbi:MAG: DUF4157 domain-containing protein [Candidatus Nitrotoga sp.]
MSTAAPLQNTADKSPLVGKLPHAGLLLQRKCACGGSASSSLSGECGTCSKKRLQKKLSIGASNDQLEQEADRIADQVLAAPAYSTISGAAPSIQRFTNQPLGETDTAPPSVDRVLASSGNPLDPALRQDMGQRFGHDFSQVRVHTGSAAEQSAADVGANAYTVGASIVFGADRYVPNSAQGRKLIAHELVHVVQQKRNDHFGLQRDLALPTLPKWTAAKLTDKQIEDAIAFNSGLFHFPETLSLIRDVIGIRSKSAQSDKELALAVGRWQAMHGLAQDGRLDPATVDSIAKELKAEQANMIRWSSGGPSPVSTPPDPKAGAASLDAMPAAAKRRVQVVTAAVALDRNVIDSIFAAPRQGATQSTFSSGLNEIFGAGIPDNAKKALGNLAGYLMRFDATKPDGSKTKALVSDSTITLEISLRPHLNFAGLFRFSRIADTSSTSAPDRLIIELIRELPPMNTKMLDLEPALTGSFTVGGETFMAGAGWRQDTSTLLRKSLLLLPSAALTAASGLTFVQTGAGSVAEAGNYNPDSDTVTIHDNAFIDSNVRAGDLPEAVATITHEIGHALDLRPLQAAWNTASAAGTAQSWAALPASRSLSGSRWQALPGPKNEFERGGEKGTTVDTGFRQAASADGFKVGASASISGSVTNYGNTNWEEAFAEAFALYATDPALLKSLRPKTHEYFTKRYPRPAPPATSPVGAKGQGKP